MQVIRWYLCPLTTNPDGRLIIPPAIRNTLQGRWTYYRLPGDQWALVRIRGEDIQHSTLAGLPSIMPWPRGRTRRWGQAAPQRLKDRLVALGIAVSGNPFPDEVLDLVGQAHQNYMGGYNTPWSRIREQRSDEPALSAVEEV